MANLNLPTYRKNVRIVDQNGSPLPFVNIVWGSTGTTTNAEGYATVSATSASQKITFSFIGLKTKSLQYANIPPVLKMEEGLEQLDPVLITSKSKTSWTTYASLAIATIGLILTLKTAQDDQEIKKAVKPGKSKPQKITL